MPCWSPTHGRPSYDDAAAGPGYAAAGRSYSPLRQRILPAVPPGTARAAAGRRATAERMAGGARGADLAGARLRPARAGAHVVRRVAGDTALSRGVDGPDQGPRARSAGQLRADPGRLRRRSAGDADPAHLHPARRSARPLQSQVPYLFCGIRPGAGVGGATGSGAGQRRHPAVPGVGPARRGDALRRRADAVPATGRVARRSGGAPRRPESC